MTCKGCGRNLPFISKRIGYCVDCLRRDIGGALEVARQIHIEARGRFNLPGEVPKDPQGVQCRYCGNACKIPLGGLGFCGAKANKNGKLTHLFGEKRNGKLQWYYDPLPTNCVAHWVCPGCSGAGYPDYSYAPQAEYGYKNLAIFYCSCTFHCLFCQNWHYLETLRLGEGAVSADELAAQVGEDTACICFFGGDPSSQILHALAVSYEALRMSEGKILRICWETNGSLSRSLLEQVIHLSMISGGIVKFDLKAWNRNLHRALCGVDNRITLSNFHYAAHFISERTQIPLLVASTLLIPGYVDAQEVRELAGFIASCDPRIPYSLLAFYPQYLLDDLPPTPRSWAMECLEAAKDAGLRNVHLGNAHLLW